MKRQYHLGLLGCGVITALLSASCTVESKKSSSSKSGGAAGSGGASSNSGGTTSNGGESSSNTAGNGGASSTACGSVTDNGQCDGAVLTYCDSGTKKSLDCASVSSACQLVQGKASCVAASRELSCGSLTKLGSCDGAIIRYCDETGMVGVPRAIDCAAYGQKCSPTAAADGGALCVPQGPCPTDVTDAGVCGTNHLKFCQDSQLYDFDCGLDTCKIVSGFADCFMAEIATGCGTETVQGRCDGQTRIGCSGNTVTSEDCAALGLECRVSASGYSCLPPTSCSATCPSGYSCSSGRCAPTATPTRDWTVAVYMVGNNNLSDSAWADLNEMEAIGSSDSLAIPVEVKFSSQYSAAVPSEYQGPAYRMLVAQDSDTSNVTSLKQATNIGTPNMSDPTSLTDFVSWAATTYPAKHFALVLWDHGAGYEGGLVDESGGNGNFMSLKQMVSGIVKSGVHTDLVSIDACLMGMHEVALSFRGVADWLAASEEIEPGNGYPYDTILKHLKDTPSLTPQQFGTAIVDEYKTSYSDASRSRFVTQSLIDLSKTQAFNAQLSNLGEAISNNMTNNRLDVMNALTSPDVLRFRISNNADVRSAITALSGISGGIGTTATAMGTAFDSSGLIAQNGFFGGTGSPNGLAVFFPSPDYTATELFQYRQETNFLPLQSWYAALTNLRNNQGTTVVPGTGATSDFSVVLSWSKSATNKSATSKSPSTADLDLYVYEPNGDFAVPVNGAVSENGILSGDSYDTGVSSESYQLKPEHQAGTYIVLVHYYDGTAGESAYPQIQLYRTDLPGGSRTYLRGQIVDRTLNEIPMDNSKPLTQMIDESNFAGVQKLDYSNIWYAFTIEVK